MSLQNVVGFWQKVQTDVALRDQVILTNRDEGLRRIVQIAGQNGFDFTQAEVLEAEAVLAFWQRVQSDGELQARLKQTRLLESEGQAAAEVVKIARDAGFVFSNDALKKISEPYVRAYAASARRQLSEEQLETIVGGASVPSSPGFISSSLAMIENGQWGSRPIEGSRFNM